MLINKSGICNGIHLKSSIITQPSIQYYSIFLFTHSVVIKTERERGEREIRELIDNKLTAV